MASPDEPVILIAEDQVVVRTVVRHQLVAEGYRVVEADGGARALDACRRDPPDVVLLDVEMPGLDGYQVLAALKADDCLAAIPVVFLTGRAGTDDIVEALRLGAHDYLRKPFEPSELSARVSAAVRVKRLQDELRSRNEELDRLSRTDALTGLHNRRHMDEHLYTYCSAARRHGLPLSVLIADIDHFKQVNDAHGHGCGDDVLREVARRLRVTLRAEDLVGRWGGEEFLAVLPHTSPEQAQVTAERLRSAVSGTAIALSTGEPRSVTLSVGIASSESAVPDALISAADQALYAAKNGGRDQVVLAP